MDRARSFEHVKNLPASTTKQLEYRETVYDRQVLLNESWENYVLRTNRPIQPGEEHTKWVTETWDEFMERKNRQGQYINDAEAAGDRAAAQNEKKAAESAENSKETIARLMRFRDKEAAGRLPSRHHLYTDFDEYQKSKFLRQRIMLESEEMLFRQKITEWEEFFLSVLAFQRTLDFSAAFFFEKQRLNIEEQTNFFQEEQHARDQIIHEEQNLRKKLAEWERSERQREEEEEEKRRERKRREEEKRNRARAERESRKSEVEEVKVEPEPEPEPAVEESEEVEMAEEKESVVWDPNSLEGANMADLFKCVTKILSSFGDNCYIMKIDRSPCQSQVICQNGHLIGEGSQEPLIGRSIPDDNCISVASKKLHEKLATDEYSYFTENAEIIPNVVENPQCVTFVENAEKQEEALLLFPITTVEQPFSPFVLGLCRQGADSFKTEEIKSASSLMFLLCQRFSALQRRKYLQNICQQCVEWISACTGCDNVYLSLEESEDVLTYVAATASHKFMLNSQHKKEQEKTMGGISFPLLESAKASEEMAFVSISDVGNAEPEGPASNPRYFKEGEKKGPLMAMTISSHDTSENLKTFGVLFLDYISDKATKKKFSSVDEEVSRSAAKTLADLLMGNVGQYENIKLKVEEGSAGGNCSFLKAKWGEAKTSLSKITPNQLLELAKYLRPPPVIPVVVQSVLLVALGSKPSKISEWDDARKKVNKKLLDKMENFDPTDLKVRKRAFFLRSKKMLKGYTADDIFDKGSYPTQCFFSWVFAALLLRKQAETIEKHKDDVLPFDEMGSGTVYSVTSSVDENLEEIGSDNETEDGNGEAD